MKIADEIEIDSNEYMCTQILFLDELTIYRVHSILGNKELFITEKYNNFQEIKDKNILKRIHELTEIKNTDMIIKL